HLAPVLVHARINSEDAFVESHLLTSIDSLSTATVSPVHSVNERGRRKIRVADHGRVFPVIFSRSASAAQPSDDRPYRQRCSTGEYAITMPKLCGNYWVDVRSRNAIQPCSRRR